MAYKNMRKQKRHVRELHRTMKQANVLEHKTKLVASLTEPKNIGFMGKLFGKLFS